MIRIGVTGGSGSGKTTVCLALEKMGIPFLDTDLVSRSVVEPGKPCLKELVKVFGKRILSKDGSLNRKKTAELAFSDDRLYAELNRITHAYIKEESFAWLEEKEKEGLKAAALDVPLLFESGWDSEMDHVIAVVSPLSLRVSRLMARDGLSEKEIGLRLSRQHPDEFYTSRADTVIVNDGDEDSLLRQTEKLLNRLNNKGK